MSQKRDRKPAILVENLLKSFDGDVVLDGVNLELGKSEALVLKGVSGSGKSTLLSLIAGLDRPDSGKILVMDKPIIKMPDAHLSAFRGSIIGMIFQNFNLIDHLTVLQNVLVPLIATEFSRREQIRLAREALEIANISHKERLLASKLSGGEKQRCAIARALALKPEIILCDEPTANLDRENSLAFIDVLAEIYREQKSIIIATHDPIFDNLPFPSRTLEISDGKVR